MKRKVVRKVCLSWGELSCTCVEQTVVMVRIINTAWVGSLYALHCLCSYFHENKLPYVVVHTRKRSPSLPAALRHCHAPGRGAMTNAAFASLWLVSHGSEHSHFQPYELRIFDYDPWKLLGSSNRTILCSGHCGSANWTLISSGLTTSSESLRCCR